MGGRFRFRVEMIGVRSVSKRDRNEDRDACGTHFSIEASPRVPAARWVGQIKPTRF